MNWMYLGIAILSEVIATSALKASEGFTKPWPVLILAVGYASSFYFLSLTLRTIPVGIAYAIWSGVGVILISLLAWWLYGQSLDKAALIGIGLIVVGVVVLNLFSESVHR
ncbi:DMT family transporter [Undibacterium squillarum]|uniref:Multidrug SMR transporter n=1 Tax=Undibacterium squillarum TaxID=1131567 RepID=A0ABQ2XSP4_9BURK|nr:multidrug efflux SMR transporter [Undibacterium squillarum]GGX31594.1 multidrug SMR transporter [Undibacterium squillarum]